MSKKDIEKIRRAILANRGGLAEATDGQLCAIWDSLDLETQRNYLAGINEKAKSKGKADAVGT